MLRRTHRPCRDSRRHRQPGNRPDTIQPSRYHLARYLTAMKALVSWALQKNWLAVDITDEVEFDPGPHVMRPFLQDYEFEPYLSACTPITSDTVRIHP